MIEVIGLSVRPSRLKEEIQGLRSAILEGKDIAADEALAKHKEWVDEFTTRYESIDESNIDGILQDEVGAVFCKVLEHAGVYHDADAFIRFVEYVNQ